jgi:hypothetical protein
MGKYDPLRAFLLSKETAEVSLTFDEIEALLGAPLPASRRYPAWWSNNPSNNPMTRVWLDAGYRTERVNVASGQVVFRRETPRGRPARGGLIARLRAALAGTVHVPAGIDLSAPTGEVWDAERL